jgi:hypothetical protein
VSTLDRPQSRAGSTRKRWSSSPRTATEPSGSRLSRYSIAGEAFETEHTRPVTIRRDGDGTVTVTESPFTDASETLGGYVIVDVADRAEAVELAKTWPTGETIEVRPISTPS